MRTVEQALAALLTGTGVGYRFTAATAVTVEIRLSSDAVQVSGALPRVESAKYTAPIAETPQTIQVIPRATLDEQGATTLTEAMRNVPGITMQAGEGGGASNTSGDMFNMRGFSAANSIFVDGVRDDGLISRDVYNLEQIEVFSGPTGSDVGRTNAAGYINLDDEDPEPRGYAVRNAQLRLRRTGTRDRRCQSAAEASANAERSWGNGAVRVNALWQDGGIAGRDYTEPREQVDRSVDRVRSEHADPRHPVGPDDVPGQPGRLRAPGGSVSGRSALAGSRSSRRRRSTRRTTTAAPTTTTTMPNRAAARCSSSTTSRRASRSATRLATTRRRERR